MFYSIKYPIKEFLQYWITSFALWLIGIVNRTKDRQLARELLELSKEYDPECHEYD